MNDLKARVEKLALEFVEIEKSLKVEEKKARIRQLEAKSTDPDLWNDQDNARKVMQELSDLTDELKQIKDLEEGIELVRSVLDEVEIIRLEDLLAKLKLVSFLSSSYDPRNAILSIHAGQGGTEAMDWAGMLYRMYLRFCEKRNWQCETIEYSQGEEAGIKSITIKVTGSYAYGYLKGESGTHRLVRQSPFNANNLRQTSFALVGILPEMEDVDLPEMNIKDEDLEWQFFHASSQGGQNVQKVSTAVRVKHLPTGIIVTAQTERFQEQNRKIALGLLKSKLWILMQENRTKEIKEIKGEYRPASWGNQIRSYVLHPYKMVKDLRTNVETGNPDAVLGGEIDEFVEAELKLKRNA